MSLWHRKTYDALIEKYKDYPSIKGRTECHHIIPRSLGGTDSVSNLVNLPFRVHFVCHWLLVSIHKSHAKNHAKMLHAFWMMSGRLMKKSSISYNLVKIKYSNLQKELVQLGEHNFCGDFHPAKLSVAAGTHHFQDVEGQRSRGQKGGKSSWLKAIETGAHSFLDSSQQSERQNRQVREGRHPFQGPTNNIASWKVQSIRDARCKNISLNKRLNSAKKRIKENRPRPGDQELVIELTRQKEQFQ